MSKIANGVLETRGSAPAAGTDPASDKPVQKDFFEQFLDYGTKFVWVSVTQVKLSPAGDDGKAVAVLFDGTTLKAFTITGDVTAAITSSGANGLDTGAEAASTFYYVWGIGKSDGTFALLLSTSASSPTMPTGYTFKRLLWGVANNGSSNFVGFEHHHDGKCVYTDTQDSSVRGISVLTGGTATSATAISILKAAPEIVGVEIGAKGYATMNDSTSRTLFVSEDSGHTLRVQVAKTVGESSGATDHAEWEDLLRNTGSLTTSFYYSWGAAGFGRAYSAYIMWWDMGTRW